MKKYVVKAEFNSDKDLHAARAKLREIGVFEGDINEETILKSQIYRLPLKKVSQAPFYANRFLIFGFFFSSIAFVFWKSISIESLSEIATVETLWNFTILQFISFIFFYASGFLWGKDSYIWALEEDKEGLKKLLCVSAGTHLKSEIIAELQRCNANRVNALDSRLDLEISV